jgi:hypothetical protein
MMPLKHRKIIFWVLMALLASGSMAAYSESEANFLVKTIGVIGVQQMAGSLIYVLCFGWDFLKPRTKPE